MYNDVVMDKEWKRDYRKEWEQVTADLRYFAYMHKYDLNKIGFVDEEHKHKKLKSDSVYLKGEA